MKSDHKQILLSVALLFVWISFVLNAEVVAQIVMSALAGWKAGDLIFNFAQKVFPNDRSI